MKKVFVFLTGVMLFLQQGYSQQDLAVDTVLTSPLSACDLNNKEVKVVIHNPSGQSIDFASTPADICLRVNASDYVYKLDGVYGTLAPLSRDTLTLTTMNFVPGNTYTLRAWISPPIDNNPSNDTTPPTTLIIMPDIKIEIGAVPHWDKGYQMVIVTNTGNFDVYDVPLEVEVQGTIPQLLRDTLRGKLPAGASQAFSFPQFYAVPSDSCFIIIYKAILACDANPQNNADTIIDCVDDIRVTDLITPKGMRDSVGETIYLTVEIQNRFSTDLRDVPIYAIISANGVSDTLQETIDTIYADSTMIYTFINSYTVPMTEFYKIHIFISSMDNYPLNDTILCTRCTVGGGRSFISGYVGYGNGQKSLSQKSVENPAENVNVYLQQAQSSIWTTVAYTFTNAAGYFEFRNVPTGRYRVMLDIAGIEHKDPQIIDLNDGDTITNIEYEITANGIVNKSGVGIEQLIINNEQLTIYPNPTSGQLIISLPNPSEGGAYTAEDIEIYNVVGQKVGTYQFPSSGGAGVVSSGAGVVLDAQTTPSCGHPSNGGEYSPFEGGRGMSEIVLDVSHLANGMYFLKVGNKTARFVKE